MKSHVTLRNIKIMIFSRINWILSLIAFYISFELIEVRAKDIREKATR